MSNQTETAKQENGGVWSDAGKKGLKLVGHVGFVRNNPRSDRFEVKRFHHVEFWCSDATNAARRFSLGLGMPIVAKSDLSTGNQVHASYLLRSAHLRFLFSAPYSPSVASPDATAAIPSFDHSTSRSFTATHGLAVRAIAIEVRDAVSAFSASVAHGAKPSFPPAVLGNGGLASQTIVAEVQLYGDVVLRYVSYQNLNPSDGDGDDSRFLPGFEPMEESASFPGLDFGIRRLDHAVGNVPELGPAVAYLKGFTGFHEFAEFTAEDVGTSESGLNSVVLASNDEMVLLPVNEPVFGTKRKSQIQTYLEHNEGAGVQHLALMSQDIFWTLKEMRQRTCLGGFDFMPSPPPTYYRNLKNRAGDVLSDEQIKECEELGILVDRDDQGTLLQIFTKPVGDRPTFFIEIIQRVGCMLKDDKGKTYQKGGCGGFGKGNISELFKSVEDYEKALEREGNFDPLMEEGIPVCHKTHSGAKRLQGGSSSKLRKFVRKEDRLSEMTDALNNFARIQEKNIEERAARYATKSSASCNPKPTTSHMDDKYSLQSAITYLILTREVCQKESFIRSFRHCINMITGLFSWNWMRI